MNRSSDASNVFSASSSAPKVDMCTANRGQVALVTASSPSWNGYVEVDLQRNADGAGSAPKDAFR